MNEIKLSGQQQKIFDYMTRHGGRITNREIMEKLQINGATARISELRRKTVTRRKIFITASRSGLQKNTT